MYFIWEVLNYQIKNVFETLTLADLKKSSARLDLNKN